jgi:hypothetical protein
MLLAFEFASLIVSIITTAVGVVGGTFAAITHSKNQTLKRQEIIMPIMDDFDKLDGLAIAKELLDDFDFTGMGRDGREEEFSREQLKSILRNHQDGTIESQGEREIRGSFDSLLNFFGKLGYLMDIGVITKTELGYFEYFIHKAKNEEGVVNYAQIYKFELFAVLLDKMGEIPLSLRSLATDYYNRHSTSKLRRFKWLYFRDRTRSKA